MKDLKRGMGYLHVGTGGALLFNCHLSFVICKSWGADFTSSKVQVYLK